MALMCASLFNPIKLAEMHNAKIIYYKLIALTLMLETSTILFYVNGIQQLIGVQTQTIQVI